MLRVLSIRDFVVVESLDLEFGPGFSVFTGETGAGKSILLDALGLLLGDRFELRQLRPGCTRAELSALFDLDDRPEATSWLADQALAAEDATLLLRRTLDAQGKSRAWINGRPATLAQLKEIGEFLVDLFGQHAHQSLLLASTQRTLVDAYGGFTTLAAETGAAWRIWRDAVRDAAAAATRSAAGEAERSMLDARRQELAALEIGIDEWPALSRTQSRLAHATELLAVAAASEAALTENDDALCPRLATLHHRLAAQAGHDPSLAEIATLVELAGIQLDEAARALRNYRDRLELDPAEQRMVEERLAVLHAAARKFRVRPEALPELLAETEARLATLAAALDVESLGREVAVAEAHFRALATQLSAKRQFAASEFDDRVSSAMQDLAMAGGRFETALEPLSEPAAQGLERIEFRVASHPGQPLGPLSRVASGGELSRIALAVQVVTSEIAAVPTLIFDEVDSGIGGTVAATVGQLLRTLATHRQVLCVTHLPQVAACADTHFSVAKLGDDCSVRTTVVTLGHEQRIEEIARMLAGSEITARARAHAAELLEQPQRRGAAGNPRGR